MKILKNLWLTLGAFFIFVHSAFAQPSQFVPATKPSNLPQSSDFGILLTKVLNYFIGLVGLIAVVMLIISGFRYLTAGGNEDATEKAKQGILYAIVGIIVVVISFALIFTVTNTLKTL